MKKNQTPLTEEEIRRIYLFLKGHGGDYITRENSKASRCNSGNYKVDYAGSMIVIDRAFSKTVSSSIPSKKVMPWELTETDIAEIIHEMPLSPLVEDIEIKEKNSSTAEISIILKPEVKRAYIKPFNIRSTSKNETKQEICSKDFAVEVDERLKQEANTYFNKHYEAIKEFLKDVPEELLKIPGFTYQGKKGPIKGYTQGASYKLSSSGILYIQRGTLNYQYDLLKGEAKASDDPFKGYRSYVEKYLKSWNKVSKFLEDGKKKYHWKVAVVPKNGIYKISMKYENFSKEFLLSAESYEQDIKNIKESIKAYEKEDKKETRNKRKDKRDRLKKTTLYGSILVDAICNLLLKNNGLSITSIVANLRGMKTNNYHMKDGKYSGKFKLLSEGTIQSTIELLVNQGILRQRVVNGTYDSYYVYDVVDYEGYTILVSPVNRKYENFTDLDWLREIDKSTYGTENIVEKLAILDHPALFCAEPSKMVKYLKTAPEGVFEYIKTMQENEKGRTKKYLKELLARLAK